MYQIYSSIPIHSYWRKETLGTYETALLLRRFAVDVGLSDRRLDNRRTERALAGNDACIYMKRNYVTY